MKKIVRGNDFTLRIPVCKMVNGEQVAFPLPACTDIQVNIVNQYRRVSLVYSIDTAEDNIILARVEGDAVSVGTYALEVRGKIFGNDWRSKEYEQFAIVDNNASGDTEFNGELIEGEDSVEMNTALVILPPTAELTQLLNDTNAALETAKQTDATLKSNESERISAEQQRVSAETSRASEENKRSENEKARQAAETERVSNEDARKAAEVQRADAESERVANEDARKVNEAARVAAEKQRATTFTELSENVDAAVSKANTAASAANTATDKANAEEGKRAEAENLRAEAEATRKQNENTRLEAESERINNESAREAAETARQNAETERVNGENDRKTSESDRELAEQQRVSAEAERMSNEDARKTAESERANKETERQTAESGREADEQERKANETERKTAEAQRKEAEEARVTAESARQTAETERVKADKERAANVATATSSCTFAAKAANDAATTATAAGEKAAAMAAEAENINVTLGGSVISVTNRKGETKTVDVVNTDEEVNVTIASSVDSIKVSGVKVNVFINNGKTPQTYTTNSEGKVSFVVNRGNYYQITFTEYGNAQPIAPVGFTAVLATRNVDVEYKPYDEESMENVVVTVTKYTDGAGAAYEGVPVSIVYDGKDIGGTTDAEGKVSAFIPYNKEYIVNVDNANGYYIRSNKNKRVYTARLPERDISYTMYPFKTGVFILDATGAEYSLEEWQAAEKTSDEAVAIKYANLNLMLHNSVFCLRTKDLTNMGGLSAESWCSKNVVFKSIPANGLDDSSDNYWNGELNTFLVMQEADEESLMVPAFREAYSETMTIGENTLNGFILTVGQELVHAANRDVVRDILSALYGSDVGSDYYSKSGSFNFMRHTSCQNKYESYSFYYKLDTQSKTQVRRVLPAFAF